MKQLSENMNIALIHDWITNVAGAEKVLLVLKELYPNATIYTSVFDPKKAKAFAEFDVVTSFLQKIPLVKSKRELLIPLTPLAFEQFDLSKYDLVISSTTMASKGVLTKPDTIHICYCHTPSRYLWETDLDPRAKKGRFRSLRASIIHKMRIWDRVAAERVDYFFANSGYIAKRIKKYYQKESTVIYPPVDVDHFEVLPKEEIKDYFLYVGRLVDYKRCDIVIQAFNKLGLPLKIIGTGPQKEQLKKIAKENIEFLGFLTDAQLKKYYSEAKAFIFAAEEDFGIVPVEAMASGRPVIAYGAGGATETIKAGETGEFFYDQTAESLIEAVRSFDDQKYDSEKIRHHAQLFSRDRFKKEFKDKVDDIIANHKLL